MRGPLCLAVALSGLHGEDLVSGVVQGLGRYFGRLKVEYRGVHASGRGLWQAVQDCAGLILLVGSGGTEYIILSGLQRYGGPVLLTSYDGHNSLPAALEVLPALRDAGVRVYPVHFQVGGRRNRRLEAGLAALAAAARLRGARIGIVGGPADWLVYSRVDSDSLVELGFQPVEIPLSRVVERFYDADREEVRRIAQRYAGRAAAQVRGEGLERAAAIYVALRSIVEEEQLQALTVRCWDLIPVLNATPCLALALLNNEGVIAGCEGDVPALITMMMASSVSREPAFMGNISDITEDTILLSHCTAPLRIGPYTITTHYETGKPVGVSVTFPSGRPATIARLHPRLYRIDIARGQLLPSRPRPRFCRTQVAVRLEGGTDWILDESTGNHYVLAIGDITHELEALSHLLGIQPIIRQ